MKTYTVHEPPNAPADRLDRAEGLVFVRDGFSWGAALLTPFWAIANRLWLVLIGYLAVVVAIQLGLRALGTGDGAVTVAMLALHLVLGLEGSSLHRWTLRRNGWRDLGSVSGRRLAECERRFFDLWLPAQPLIRAQALAQSSLAGGSRRFAGPDATARLWLRGLGRARLQSPH